MYKENTDTISIITGSTCAQVAIDVIEFIDREGKSLLIYTSSYIYKTFAKIDDIAYPLIGRSFFRPLVGLIINFDKVRKIDKYEIEFESGRKIGIGRNNHSKIRRAYKKYLFRYPPYVTVDWESKPHATINSLWEDEVKYKGKNH